MSSVTDLKNIWPLVLRSYPYSETCCNFHMICKYCSKYEYARSKNEIAVRVWSRRQVLSISDLDL